MKNEQVLDKLQVERERGITVKAQTASLVHTYDGEEYLLNLIDTPVSTQKSWYKKLLTLSGIIAEILKGLRLIFDEIFHT